MCSTLTPLPRLTAFGPEVVFRQLTDLPDDAAELAGYSDRNDRMRSEGTRNLLAAAGPVATATHQGRCSARMSAIVRSCGGTSLGRLRSTVEPREPLHEPAGQAPSDILER